MDIALYQRAEALAKMVAPSWRHKQAHHPVAFAAAGFPVQVDSVADLMALTDTMQEGRFETYQTELGGLSPEDFEKITFVLVDFAHFFRSTFHTDSVPLPLATMLAQYVAFLKIEGWRGEDATGDVLEIGPGCGYLAFFLLRSTIKRYAQVENTESFYILQNLVNAHCFGRSDQTEHAAFSPLQDRGHFYTEWFTGQSSVMVHMPERPSTVDHYPWWRSADLIWSGRKFDVVVANAVLNEMSTDAFKDYVHLIDKVLKPDGALIVQCFGGGTGKLWDILDAFERIKLAPLVLCREGGVPGHAKKGFAVPNGVWVRESHPLFSDLHGRKDFGTFPDLPVVRRMFGPAGGNRRTYTPGEFANAVQKLLKGGA